MQIKQKHNKASQSTTTTSRPQFITKIGLVGLGILLGIITVNSALAAQLTGTIYPGVSVLGHDLSWKTRAQAVRILQGVDTTQAITVKVGDKVFATDSEALGAARDVQATVQSAYQVGRQNPWALAGILGSAAHGQVGFAYQISSVKLDAFASKISAEIGKPPQDAQVIVTDGVISTVPDQDGVQADKNVLGHLLQNALARGSDQSVTLSPSLVKAGILLSHAETIAESARQLSGQHVGLTFNGKSYVPKPATVAGWLQFTQRANKDGVSKIEMSVDAAKVSGYVQTIANEINIVPINKKITIKNGVSTTDREGQDGTALNQDEIVAGITAALNKNQPFDKGLTVRPVAFKTEYNRITTLDVGRYIEINLSNQRLWVYQDNKVIYESPITSGATGAGFPTVTGLFSIYAKAQNTHLIGYAYGPLYNYDVFVQYWMPFYSGFGLHDASWRSVYGGQDYYYNGSHGCVNLPLETAAFLYNWADIGTPVWVHY